MRITTQALVQVFGKYGLTESHLDKIRQETLDECLLIFHFVLGSAELPVEHRLKLQRVAETLSMFRTNEIAESAMRKMRETQNE